MSTSSAVLMHLRSLGSGGLEGRPLIAVAEEIMNTALLLEEGRDDVPQASNAIGQLRAALRSLIKFAETPKGEGETLNNYSTAYLHRIKSATTMLGGDWSVVARYPPQTFPDWVHMEFPETNRWGISEQSCPWPDSAKGPPARAMSRLPAKYRSWREVLAAPWDEILAIKNIGPLSLVELRACFQDVGIHWPEQGIPIPKAIDEPLFD